MVGAPVRAGYGNIVVGIRRSDRSAWLVAVGTQVAFAAIKGRIFPESKERHRGGGFQGPVRASRTIIDSQSPSAPHRDHQNLSPLPASSSLRGCACSGPSSGWCCFGAFGVQAVRIPERLQPIQRPRVEQETHLPLHWCVREMGNTSGGWECADWVGPLHMLVMIKWPPPYEYTALLT